MNGAFHAPREFASFSVGDAVTFSKTITEADIALFAGVSGDTYPLHMDAEYAKGTRFKQVNGLMLGTPDGIYVEQSLRFRRPVFIGDTLTARSEITSIDPLKRRLHCATTVTNQTGKVVIDGAAVLQKD
jgi:3-hydroxybutyryl-CoA dehydratase